MTRLVRFSNNAVSRLAANITNADTSISLTPGDGAKFPVISGSQFFMATLLKADGTTEIVKVTARSSDTLTVVRAAEPVGATQVAYAFTAGDRIEQRMTAKALSDELDRLDSGANIGTANKTANYTVLANDVSTLIRVDTTAGAITVTLPQISSLTDDFDIMVAKVTSDANLLNVVRAGSTDLINGVASYVINNQWQSVWLIADRSTSTWTAINSGAGSTNVTVDIFTGSGTAGPFTLSGDPGSKNNTAVYVGGVYQQKATYTLSGTTLTLGGIVAAGVAVEVVWSQPNPIGVPSDGTVTDAKVAADAGIQASKLEYTPVGTNAVSTDVQSKLQETVSVKDFKCVDGLPVQGDGVHDDATGLQAAFNHIAVNGGTLIFPDGEYVISTYVTLKGSNGGAVSARRIRILGGPGVVIRQTNVSSSYPRDGFRIGNASAQDGGTGTGINIQDVVVDGFEFKNCRIGVWVVYARDVLVQNIKADRTAVVAIGNDADDNCENITVRNIYRTAEFDGTFFTVAFFSTKGFRLENVHSPFAVTGEAVTISTSTHGTVDGLYIDQQDSGSSGLALTDGTQYITVSNFVIRNAGLGIVTIDNNAATRDKVSVIGHGIIEGGVTAISAQAGGTIFHDIQTNGNTTSLALGSDAQNNKFRSVTFREGVISDPSNVKYLQTFADCEGISSRCGFFATDNTGALNVTGDGTDYTMTWNGEQTDINGDFNPTTGVFTAPRDGLYRFDGSVFLVDWGSSGYSAVQLKLVTTPRTIMLDYRAISSNAQFHGSALVHMNRGNTARLVINASGGSKNADINNDASFNYFCGTLVSGGEL